MSSITCLGSSPSTASSQLLPVERRPCHEVKPTDELDAANTAPGGGRASLEPLDRARWALSFDRRWRAYGVAALALGSTLGVLLLVPGTAPSAEPAYAPAGAALPVGALVSIRLRPNE